MSVNPVLCADTATVVPWIDPVVESLGHDPRSRYVEEFWLGLLGPTATWVMRRLAGRLDDEPDGFELDLNEMAGEVGVGSRSGPHAPFSRSLQRCCRFGLIAAEGSVLRVRRALPPLTRFQLDRVPARLREAHRAWEAPATAADGLGVERIRRRARHLALSLLELGEDAEATERQLHRWQVHPALAHDAVAWAVARRRQGHVDAAARSDHEDAGGSGGTPVDLIA